MHDRRALVRRPSSRLAEGLVTHIERTPVDVDLAMRQWENYVAALHDAGWTTVEVPPMEECPDGVFIEDDVGMYGERAVVARPGADERKPETAAIASLLGDLGYDVVSIEAPGTLDGGDVLEPYGARVVAVPIEKVLHLKSAVTALPDGTVVGYEPLVDNPGVWESFLPVPEESGSHVVLLGGTTVLMSTDAPRSKALFEERGLDVVAVDISEFIKLEGCVTCLSVRLRHTP